MARLEIKAVINNQDTTLSVYPMARLLDVIREAGWTGSKEGCGEGECGACTVLIDGRLVNSCLVPALQADGARIETIEGVAQGDELDRVQACFVEHGGAQCGICTPGMVMAARQLLSEKPRPSLEEVREGLAGNLCRCTGYMKIFESVVAACQRSEV